MYLIGVNAGPGRGRMLQRVHTPQSLPSERGNRVRTALRVVFVGLAVLLGLAPTTPAAAQDSGLAVALSPASGYPGSSFRIYWQVRYPAACKMIQFTWAGAPLVSAVSAAEGSVPATVPAGVKAGSYTVRGVCGNYAGSASFGVLQPPPPTTNPPPTTATPPVTVPTIPATTTRRPVTTTTTTRPSVQTSTETPITVPTEPSGGQSSQPTEPGMDLTLDRTFVQPGEAVVASGQGCQPNSAVRLFSHGEPLGTAQTDAGGTFTARVEFSTVEPGRRTITAECGIVLTGSVDQVVTSSTGGGSTALVVLVFFVLAGAALIRFG